MVVRVLLNKIHLIKSISLLQAGAFLILFISCTKREPDYYSKLPENYVYSSIEDWALISSDTISIEKIYDSSLDKEGQLSKIVALEEVAKDRIWIADLLNSRIVEFGNKSMNDFKRIVLGTGYGPAEVIRPSAIYRDRSGSDKVYIIDSENSCINIVSKDELELDRKCSKHLPIAMLSSNLRATDSSFYVNTLRHSEFTVIELDNDLKIKKGEVPRIVPLGFQPSTYNRTVFDLNNSRLVFSYKGLPIIFIKDTNSSRGRALNLMPNKMLADFNVSLDPQPENKQVSVEHIIRDIFIHENKLLVSLYSSLYIFNLDSKSYSIINFRDSDNHHLKFNMFTVSSENLYAIDGYKNDIYMLSLNNL